MQRQEGAAAVVLLMQANEPGSAIGCGPKHKRMRAKVLSSLREQFRAEAGRIGAYNQQLLVPICKRSFYSIGQSLAKRVPTLLRVKVRFNRKSCGVTLRQCVRHQALAKLRAGALAAWQ